MEEFNYADYLGSVSIERGDVVDVASDLLGIAIYCQTKGLKFNADHLIDAILDRIGTNGTVMIRTFTWAFCKGETFDILHSLSQVGALGNCALKRKDFVRTRHPIYSWMVWGKHAEMLRNYDNTDGFDGESIFQFLYDYNAKQLTLGNMPYLPITMSHYAEVMVNVPYRMKKPFKAGYVDENGERSVREYSMYVRPLNIQVELKEIVDILKGLDILTESSYDGILSISVTDLPNAADYVMGDIKDNDGKNTVRVEGVDGIMAAGVDFSTAQYY